MLRNCRTLHESYTECTKANVHGRGCGLSTCVFLYSLNSWMWFSVFM